jgi:hypothetical protein
MDVWLWLPVPVVATELAVNAYDRWPRAGGGAYTARAQVAMEDGLNYPTMYGRFAGARRAAPMAVPARASLVNPYASWAGATRSSEDLRGAQQQTRGLSVGSAASRDLYATSDGNIYRRQDGNWYRADPAGKWTYAAPAVGPKTTAYGATTSANVQRPAQYDRAQGDNANVERPVQFDQSQAAALDQDYQARAMADQRWQQYRAAGAVRYGGSRGGRR